MALGLTPSGPGSPTGHVAVWRCLPAGGIESPHASPHWALCLAWAEQIHHTGTDEPPWLITCKKLVHWGLQLIWHTLRSDLLWALILTTSSRGEQSSFLSNRQIWIWESIFSYSDLSECGGAFEKLVSPKGTLCHIFTPSSQGVGPFNKISLQPGWTHLGRGSTA